MLKRVELTRTKLLNLGLVLLLSHTQTDVVLPVPMCDGQFRVPKLSGQTESESKPGLNIVP